MALLGILASRSVDFSPYSQRELLDEADRPMMTEKKMTKAAWERLEAVSQRIGLLALHFFCHSHGLLSTTGFYTLDDGKLLECKAVRQLHLFFFVLRLVFALL